MDYKYKKMINGVLVKSNYKINESDNRYNVGEIKQNFSIYSCPKVLKTLIINYPLTNKEILEVNSSFSRVKTVGELIELLQKLPKDTPYKEDFAGLFLDFSDSKVNDDTMESHMFLTSGE